MSPELTFFDALARLEEILDRYDGEATALDELKPILEDSDVLRECLARLDNASWIQPLRDGGYFDAPPEPVRSPGGGFQHPRWPQGEFLVRMAVREPQLVADVLTKLPTTNISVVGDVLAAAMQMPAEIAAGLSPKLAEAATAGTLWIHFKDASDLCVRLAHDGAAAAALALAGILFGPRPGEGEDDLIRRDAYWYKDGLGRVVPVLAEKRPAELLERVCQWLEEVLDEKESTDRAEGQDASYWWRPAVEEHEQNRDSDMAGLLAGFVRQSAEDSIRRGGLALDAVRETLAGHPYLIFSRIRIHLAGEFGELDPVGARQAIMSRELFDDFRYKHEYARVVGRRFGLLTEGEREQWYAWLDDGPDMTDFDDRFHSRKDRAPTEAERRARLDYWRFEKLHWVRDSLDPVHQAFYSSMLSEHGEPELADLNVRTSSGWGGRISPISLDDLSGLTFPEVVDRVSEAEPTEDPPWVASTEGLAATFGEYLSRDAVAFSAQAQVLNNRPPIYIQTFLSQMIAAVKGGHAVDVDSVLALCEGVVNRPEEGPLGAETDDDTFADRRWQWARDEVARFTMAVCQALEGDRPRYSPQARRDRMWKVIEALSYDPDESGLVVEADRADPITHDFFNEAINSPHGRAVEAGLEYARWLANHLKVVDEPRQRIPGGLDSMPEVRTLLERVIRTEPRSTFAHAIIGSRIGLLHWIDKGWLESNASQLFLLDGIEEDPPVPQGWAAWNAFLVWVRPHIEFYNIFETQYATAVRQSIWATPPEGSYQDPVAHLGEHLMVLYGRGDLPLDSSAGPVGTFIMKAPREYRTHAMKFVGRVLESEPNLPEEFVSRYQLLWEEYWAAAGSGDAQGDPDSLPFGHWLASGRFDPRWALAQLEAFVEVQPLPQPDHAVMEYLASVVSQDVYRSVSILARMVSGDREGWRTSVWMDSVREILRAGAAADDPARAVAESVIDTLGRRGFTDIGALLRGQ